MTDKKTTSISRHKAVISKQPSGAPLRSAQPGQSFDIIPAAKVMPSPNARPVITSSQPAQADNTLTLTPSAPLISDLQHSAAADAHTIDDAGKKSFMSTPPLTSANPGDTLLETPAPKSAPEVTTATADPVKPVVPTGLTVSERLAGQAHSTGERTIAPPVHDAAPDEVKTAELPEVSEPPKPDSVAEIFATENAAGRSAGHAEHSDGFKDAIQDLETSPEGKHPLHQSGESMLYGGKPVIIIHEPHPLRSIFSLIFWFIVCLILIFIVLNFLLDAGVVSTSLDIPHTNVLQP